MSARRPKFISACAIVVAVTGTLVQATPPKVLSDRYQLEMVASEPGIVTPIGLAFDPKGRLLVVESQTHMRSEGYQGSPSDRIRMFADTNDDGKLDQWSTFAEGFRFAMNVFTNSDGEVYVVTRQKAALLRDTDDDNVADQQEELLRLETKSEYPHNGLGGITLDPLSGDLLVGLGENLGVDYRLVGVDGRTLEGRDGAGCIFRCSPQGKNLSRMATGLWNPFGICVVPDGRVFAVDNDPGASPPCRLLHIVPGGDYGFRYLCGGEGIHPLMAWNGELPGTLPMACGVGEGPTAIVVHGGWLWVTSWGDHRIERYRLVPRGVSYSAEREVIVQGDVEFRPTGMAVAPDGSLYFGDWVLRDYPVHGRGRIWRLTLPKEDIATPFPARTQEDLCASNADGDILAVAEPSDPFVQSQMAQRILRAGNFNLPRTSAEHWRLCILQAHCLQALDHPEQLLREALDDESAEIRLFAIRWIVDERITELRSRVAQLLDGPQPNARYYLAVLSALDWLDNGPKVRGGNLADEILERELNNQDRTAATHALALGFISPENKFLTLDRLREYLAADYAPLRLAAIRTVAQQVNPERYELLAATASEKSQSEEVRAEAIMGLAAAAENYRDLLQQFADSNNVFLSNEAERVLQLARMRPASTEVKPPAEDLASWNELLDQPGDAAAGRRLFFSGVGARCSLCHQYARRGGHIGPDLTRIGRSSSRERIVSSILQPSQEIAPQYQSWVLTTDDGKTRMGLRLAEASDNSTEEYIDSDGQRFILKCKEVELREAAMKSIMPDGLEMAVSIADLRNLVAFLMHSSDDPQ